MTKRAKKDLVCLILAAGQGTRMKSETPKVLHELCGKPMIEHVVETAGELDPAQIYLIVGFKEELLRQHFGERVGYITQSEQLGTGHAVMQAKGKDGIVVEEIQKGYKLHDRVLRPSKVVVGNGEEDE